MAKTKPRCEISCPYCGDRYSRVLKSRGRKDATAIARRRECAACRRRFTTSETIVPDARH